VAALGVDETSFLKATRVAPTRWITGLVDLDRGRLLEVVADRTRAAVAAGLVPGRGTGWPASPRSPWTRGAGTPAPWWPHSVMRPWWWTTSIAIRLANAVVDQVRRRTEQATLGHRGRKPDPLYRIRKLLLTAA
jgi:transposase